MYVCVCVCGCVGVCVCVCVCVCIILWRCLRKLPLPPTYMSYTYCQRHRTYGSELVVYN